MEYRRHPETRLLRYLIAPVIYSVLLPALLFDLIMEIYHRVCFPVYGYPYVKRSHYIRVDRQKLQYLRWFEKLNCAYCGYVNGLLLYTARIAQESERFWCGVMHEKREGYEPPPYQRDFLPFGDEAAYTAYVKRQKPEAK